jgi:hypothetical protein
MADVMATIASRTRASSFNARAKTFIVRKYPSLAFRGRFAQRGVLTPR